jgi:flavorubredoxin
MGPDARAPISDYHHRTKECAMHSINKTHLTPTRIAPETFLIHDHEGEGRAPVCVAVNSMVIRGAEPVVVDTGAAENRKQFFDDVFGIVEPDDVRWMFISHDDVDHTGNVNALMAACPNATLVINWFMVERMGASLQVPPDRWRWLGDGEALDVGDRVLQAVRPPVFDSPTTRGLFDPTSGVYWGSDSFASPMLQPTRDVADLDREFWAEGVATFSKYVSPWLDLVDDKRYQDTVDRVAALRPSVITGCHTPVIRGARVAEVIEVTRRTPSMTVAPQPDQSVLEQIQRTLAGDLAA